MSSPFGTQIPTTGPSAFGGFGLSTQAFGSAFPFGEEANFSPGLGSGSTLSPLSLGSGVGEGGGIMQEVMLSLEAMLRMLQGPGTSGSAGTTGGAGSAGTAGSGNAGSAYAGGYTPLGSYPASSPSGYGNSPGYAPGGNNSYTPSGPYTTSYPGGYGNNPANNKGYSVGANKSYTTRAGYMINNHGKGTVTIQSPYGQKLTEWGDPHETGIQGAEKQWTARDRQILLPDGSLVSLTAAAANKHINGVDVYGSLQAAQQAGVKFNNFATLDVTNGKARLVKGSPRLVSGGATQPAAGGSTPPYSGSILV